MNKDVNETIRKREQKAKTLEKRENTTIFTNTNDKEVRVELDYSVWKEPDSYC